MYCCKCKEFLFTRYALTNQYVLFFINLSVHFAAELLGETNIKVERADTPDSIGGYEFMTLGKVCFAFFILNNIQYLFIVITSTSANRIL